MINIVSVGIDKVQTFIYHVLQVNIQENQTNSGTLKKIIQSSDLISRQFYRNIGLEEGGKGEFTGHIKETLLKCSGMCIFSTTLSEEVIIEKLDSMFQRFHEEHRGQLLLKYVCFQQALLSNEEKLGAIKRGKKLLTGRECMNEIIQRHAEKLFQFNCLTTSQGEIHSNDIRIFEKSDQKKISKDSVFVEEIDGLYSENEAPNSNRFRTVVIKADLDGVGSIFKRTNCFQTYQKISEILSDYISLEYLSSVAEKIRENNKEFRLYPLYVAGDDIFFVVPISQIIAGIDVCREILKKINHRLSLETKENSVENLTLSMSIGVDFTFNREPIRYYYARVEEQMELAKRAEKIDEKSGEIKIAIQGYVFYIFDDKTYKANTDKPNWIHFTRDMDKLTNMKNHLQKAYGDDHELHNFFYSFLQKITNSIIRNDKIKYSNTFIYHLLPQYLGDSNSELQDLEVLLLESLIKKMCEKKEGEWSLSFEDKRMKDMEGYIRLLLLFTDKRFNKQGSHKSYELAKKDIKKIRSTLFNKTLRYLYENNLNKEPELSKIFVEKKEYENESGIIVFCKTFLHNIAA